MKNVIILLLSVLLIAGCSNDENVTVSETIDNEESTKKENYISPEEYVTTMGDEYSKVEYDDSTKTFIFKLPTSVKDELINENNNYHTDEEYEETIASVESDMVDTAQMIVEYYDRSYSVLFQIDNGSNDTLLKYEDNNLVKNNIDMRHMGNSNDSQSKFASEKDEQQYDIVGDYIYIDFRDYVDELEDLIIDFYRNDITEDVFVDELGVGHSELTYYCTNLLPEGDDSDETLSDDISKLMANAFLSCTTLQSAYFNLMLPSSDGTEAGELLEEAIEYFTTAKNIYDSY